MKITPIALALCLSVVPVASVVAADPPATQQSITLKFQTIITATPFTIKPKNALPLDVTDFEYDKIRLRFTSYENEFAIKSAGKVTAKLEKAAELVAAKNKIPLDVTLGGTKLGTAASEIHAGGTDEKSYNFVISPTGGVLYPAGTYKGDVVLLFDVG